MSANTTELFDTGSEFLVSVRASRVTARLAMTTVSLSWTSVAVAMELLSEEITWLSIGLIEQDTSEAGSSKNSPMPGRLAVREEVTAEHEQLVAQREERTDELEVLRSRIGDSEESTVGQFSAAWM